MSDQCFKCKKIPCNQTCDDLVPIAETCSEKMCLKSNEDRQKAYRKCRVNCSTDVCEQLVTHYFGHQKSCGGLTSFQKSE